MIRNIRIENNFVTQNSSPALSLERSSSFVFLFPNKSCMKKKVLFVVMRTFSFFPSFGKDSLKFSIFLLNLFSLCALHFESLPVEVFVPWLCRRVMSAKCLQQKALNKIWNHETFSFRIDLTKRLRKLKLTVLRATSSPFNAHICKTQCVHTTISTTTISSWIMKM